MNIKDFTRQITATSLNEGLAKKFGQKIDLNSFTTEQLQDVRNKLRTKMSQIETTESFDSTQRGGYQKNKLFLDVLNAEIAEREGSIVHAIDEAVRTVREGKEDEAEIVMAAKDMVDRITNWMEDTSEMQAESMLELADAIRDELGVERADQFTSSIKPALETLYQTMETTRETLTSGVGMLTGEQGAMEPMGADDTTGMDSDLGSMDSDMGTDDSDMDLDLGPDLDADDDFEAAGAAAGGDELGGREKRESVQRPGLKKK